MAWLGKGMHAIVAAALAVLPLASAAGEEPWSDVPAERVLSAVVGIRAHVPDNARTAESLGTEREGSGVVIGPDGLVVTIGYLILEADRVEVGTGADEGAAASIVAYDPESGFGLVRTAPLPEVRPMEFGDSRDLKEGDPLLVASFRRGTELTPVKIASRRPFAGYWEYLLEDAIFTRPPHRHFGGAALIAQDGRLVGIGSLLVGDARSDDVPSPGNMFVPVEVLEPILAELLAEGHRSGPPPPWLGVFTQEIRGRLFVAFTAAGGPADAAGLERGDIIVGVGGERVADMADFYRKVRALGPAGTTIPLDVVRRGSVDLTIERIAISSADRMQWLRAPTGG